MSSSKAASLRRRRLKKVKRKCKICQRKFRVSTHAVGPPSLCCRRKCRHVLDAIRRLESPDQATIDRQQRQIQKALNFGLLYGATSGTKIHVPAAGASITSSTITVKEAKELLAGTTDTTIKAKL